jgi:hypothetical protein
MPKFVTTRRGGHVNLDYVLEFRRGHDGTVAVLRDGGTAIIGAGEYADRLIAVATGTIVPAAPDATLHRFYIDDASGQLVHERERILAWAIDASNPTPITADGVVFLGLDGLTRRLDVIQHPDGRYDDAI